MDKQVAVVRPLEASAWTPAKDINKPDSGNGPPFTLGSVDDPNFQAIGKVAGKSERGSAGLPNRHSDL
jgi:hypothetical protein